MSNRDIFTVDDLQELATLFGVSDADCTNYIEIGDAENV